LLLFGLGDLGLAGNRPLGRALPGSVRERFLDLAERLGRLTPDEVRQLNPVLPVGMVVPDRPDRRGIF
jgi:hypothetical protein